MAVAPEELRRVLAASELFELLDRSDDARIVNHSSAARRGPDLEPRYFGPHGGDLGGDGSPEENTSFGGPRWRRYQQTKLAKQFKHANARNMAWVAVLGPDECAQNQLVLKNLRSGTQETLSVQDAAERILALR